VTVWAIGNNMPNWIINDRDELSYDDNILLKNMKFINRGSFECTRLREYIAQSSQTISTNSSFSNITIDEAVVAVIKFESYCDSIWDMKYGIDEIDCYKWKCNLNYLYP